MSSFVLNLSASLWKLGVIIRIWSDNSFVGVMPYLRGIEGYSAVRTGSASVIDC